MSNGENTEDDGTELHATAETHPGTGAGPDGTEGGEARRTARRFSRMRRRHWVILATAVTALIGSGVTVPVVASGEPDCWEVPASVEELADAPAEATEALDPGESLFRIDEASSLLTHDHVCGDGARVLGRMVEAATGAAGKGGPHTMAQARSAYAVVAVLSYREIPEGLAPGVARMLAEYPLDVTRGLLWEHHGEEAPALPSSAAALDPSGFTRTGRFLSPRDSFAGFAYDSSAGVPHPNLEQLIAELAKDPVAFATLYDAERARFAYYLEHLTDQGEDPNYRPQKDAEDKHSSWVERDLRQTGENVANLMQNRADHARRGTISDLEAFDAVVRHRTRGTFRPASRRLTSVQPMGRIAERPVTGPIRGPLMDGRHQLFTVFDRWAELRGVPSERAKVMRQLLEDGYVRGLWHTGV
ncbi:hypothetical protein [Streptomyces sp. TR02-1]|uniref:hypothetical protein n=1 Tax=Streptomyces sp. TR02-1 TaxID=3385977 RepID=UPI0039A18E8B